VGQTECKLVAAPSQADIDFMSRFRWVVCQLDTLKRCLKVNMIRDALKNLPRTLDDTYTRVFLDIDEAYRQEAKNALLWLAFSARPLRITELAEAIVLRPTSDPAFDPEERFPDPQSVLQILSSLVTVSANEVQTIAPYSEQGFEPTMTVTLAHFSVKEYLISNRMLESAAKHFAVFDGTAHHTLATSCLLYILHYASSHSRIGAREDLHTFPLLEYASVYWYRHINMAPLEQQELLTPLALNLLLSESALSCWLDIHVPSLSPNGRFDRSKNPASSLWYASTVGLFHVVQHLLVARWDPNGGYPGDSLPLNRAIMGGHEKVVSILLDHRANVDLKDLLGYAPLHYAAEEGKTSVLQILLDHGANVNVKTSNGWTPLHLAAYHCHESIAYLLVERGAEVEVATTYSEQTPLHWAAWNDAGDLVEFFLRNGADINARNSDDETALHYAAVSHRRILRLLLERGADPDIETVAGDTPLHWAALNGSRRSNRDVGNCRGQHRASAVHVGKERVSFCFSSSFQCGNHE
jgi:ankyrin repeat protein